MIWLLIVRYHYGCFFDGVAHIVGAFFDLFNHRISCRLCNYSVRISEALCSFRKRRWDFDWQESVVLMRCYNNCVFWRACSRINDFAVLPLICLER